jgi:hypothetical protein
MKGSAWFLVGGAALTAVVLWWWLRPSGERLDPPAVLQQRVLESNSVEVQSQAARDMLRHDEQARPEARRMLAEYRGSETAVLVPLVEGVQKQRDWRSLPRLFELLEHPDARVRGKAGAAAREIMGADYGFRAEDPPEVRFEAIQRMRLIHKTLVPQLERFYSAQER